MSKKHGTNKIDDLINDWSEDDRQDAIEFALHPGNGTTATQLYLREKNVIVSISTVHRWQKSLFAESNRIKGIKNAIEDYKGLEPQEIIAFVAASMAEALISLQQRIEKQEVISHRDIQSITSLAKEARSAAISMQTPQSAQSIKELELGIAVNIFDKLNAIFEEDETLLDRLKLAAKGILIEIEGQYQN